MWASTYYICISATRPLRHECGVLNVPAVPFAFWTLDCIVYSAHPPPSCGSLLPPAWKKINHFCRPWEKQSQRSLRLSKELTFIENKAKFLNNSNLQKVLEYYKKKSPEYPKNDENSDNYDTDSAIYKSEDKYYKNIRLIKKKKKTLISIISLIYNLKISKVRRWKIHRIWLAFNILKFINLK